MTKIKKKYVEDRIILKKGATAGELAEAIQEAKNKGWKNIDCLPETPCTNDFYDDSRAACVRGYRLQTEKEIKADVRAKKVASERRKRAKERKRQKEFKEFHRLAEKFGYDIID